MKFRTTLVLTLCALLLLIAACDSGLDNNAPRSGSVGVRVETPTGAYMNLSPLELKALLAQKDFPLINVHIPYEGEIEKNSETHAFFKQQTPTSMTGMVLQDLNKT